MVGQQILDLHVRVRLLPPQMPTQMGFFVIIYPMKLIFLTILAAMLIPASFCPADDYLRIGFELPRDTIKSSSGLGVVSAKSQSGLDNFVFYVGRSPNYAWAGTLNGLGRLDLNSLYWDSFHADDGLGADSFPSLLYLPDRGRLIVHPQRCSVLFQTIFAYWGYGLRISDDEGQSWREVDAAPFVGSGSCAWRMIENNGKLYAACWYRGLAHSEDGGDSGQFTIYRSSCILMLIPIMMKKILVYFVWQCVAM